MRKCSGEAPGKLENVENVVEMYSRRSIDIYSGKSLRIVFALTSILEAFAFAVQILTLLRNMYLDSK